MPTNYWNDRNIRTQTRLQNKSVAEIEKEQARLYKKAMKQTIKDFESTYNKYLLQLAEGQEPSPALMYNMDKYWQMQADLRERCKELGDTEVELYSKRFEEYYQDIYDSTVLPSADSFHTISTGNAEQVVNQVWCADGKSWSSRVWNNQSYLQQTLNNQLINCVTTGANPARLTRLLTERFNVARHRANTLVRTEMAHITTQAAKNRYLDYGLEEYEFLADPDERTCEECAELNGKRFKLSEMDAGVNAPPIHPNDRCTIIPIIPDEVGILVEEEAPMVEQFVLATSIEEAEQYISQYVDGSGFGALGVSYQGIDLEVANQINKTIGGLYNKYNVPPMGGIIAPAGNTKLGKMMSGATAAYSPVRNSFLVNRQSMKTMKVAEKSFASEKTALSNLLNHPERYDFSKLPKRTLDIIERSKISGRTTVPDNVDEALTHEFGHMLEKQIKGHELYGSVKADMSIYADGISGYAGSEISEYIAESFASYEKGEKLIDPKLETIFKSLMR